MALLAGWFRRFIPPWIAEGLCGEHPDPDLFFPARPENPTDHKALMAKAVCLRCPVQAKCLAWALPGGALPRGIPCGVFGGTTGLERQMYGAMGPGWLLMHARAQGEEWGLVPRKGAA